jgi:phosphoesterase RecJ-like protein
MNNIFLEVKNKIEQAESIIIFSHVSPDGDTLGSNLALSLMIEKYFNKKVDSVFVGTLPATYTYLPDFNRFQDVQTIDKNKKYDLAIAVDVASKDRIVYGIPIFDNAGFKINIDHHKTNNGYGDINIIDGDEPCVGSILYKIFKAWELEIPKEVARCLYTSLLTDTGGFKYENTTPETFMLAADLVRLGVSPTYEFRACYETKPQSMIQFQAYVVANTIFYNNGQIAFSKITRSDMSKFDASDEYTEGIVETLRTSKNVEISAILKETKEGYTKVSLRSKKVNLIPIVIDFGGGGHTFAAGCTIKKPIAIAFDKLLKRVQSEIE